VGDGGGVVFMATMISDRLMSRIRLGVDGEATRWFELTNTFWEACMRLVKAYAIQSQKSPVSFEASGIT
jgi:hypothetical protein